MTLTYTARELCQSDLLHADLPPTTLTVGADLLDLTNDACGHVTLTWSQFLDLCGVQTRGAARRHLTRLSQAGLIHYSTNDYVYINFLAWMDDERIPHAPDPDHPRAETGSPTRQIRRVDAPETIPPHTPLIRIGGIGIGGGGAREEPEVQFWEEPTEAIAEKLHTETFGPPAADRQTIRAFHEHYPESHIREAYQQAGRELDKGRAITSPTGYLSSILDRLSREGITRHATPRRTLKTSHHRPGARQGAQQTTTQSGRNRQTASRQPAAPLDAAEIARIQSVLYGGGSGPEPA